MSSVRRREEIGHGRGESLADGDVARRREMQRVRECEIVGANARDAGQVHGALLRFDAIPGRRGALGGRLSELREDDR